MDVANEEAKRLNDEYISTEHILLAIASERNTASANILREANITKEQIYQTIEELRNGKRVTEPNAESKYRVLAKYGHDLTQAAIDGKLDPVVGREPTAFGFGARSHAFQHVPEGRAITAEFQDERVRPGWTIDLAATSDEQPHHHTRNH